MPEFTLNGIVLDIPQSHLTAPLEQAFRSGSYEHAEAEALGRHLRPRDRLLELGSGAGYLLTIGGLLLQPGAAVGVEASAATAEIARATVARNGVTAELLWGAVVPDDHPGETATLHVRPSFWASSLGTVPESGRGRTETVPALRFGALLDRFRPSVLVLDIEGGELALFDRPLPDPPRLVIMELHPVRYRAAGVRRIFDGLSASGLAYCPVGSAGRLVVFERIDRRGAT